MQEREDSKLIIEMRKTLQLGDYRPEEMRKGLQEYRQLLRARFDSDRHRQKMGLADFLKTPAGRDWGSEGPLLLVLFGRNEVGVSTVSHSWLSPVAVDLVDNLLESNRTVAYENCTESSTLVGVISRLIFQLLEKSPAVIRRGNDLHDIESQLSLGGQDRVIALRKALLRIINLQNDRVFIVLNRPDICEEESPAEYIETMLSLLKDAKQGLKIMMVQRSEIWDAEKNRRGIDTQGIDQRIFQTVRFDQCRVRAE